MKPKVNQNWLDSIQNEWKDMALHLSKNVPEGQIRDRLYDQLSWLKEQIDGYQPDEADPSMLRDCFNEVVESFNQELKLKRDSIFRKK